MASPFSVFRKHRTIMLAGLTILAMFGFVFLPIMLESMGARGVVDPVVVKTSRYGKITQNQLFTMMAQHQRLLSVLVSAVASLGVNPNQATNFVNGMFGDDSEESVVNGWLEARRAEQLGLVVSNESIRSFLRDFTRNSLKSDDLRKILAQQQVSELQFFQAFHDELLAMRLREMFQASLAGTPPAQRWDYYTRLKRNATAEVVPVAVERFVSQVPDPDEATLQKFFDEHKDNIKLPDSPEPGFRESQRVDIRYFKADLEKFMAALTDEEVKQEYEKNKDAYDKQEAAENKQSAPQQPAGEKPPAEKPSAEKPTGERPSTETPASEKPAAEKPGSEKPSTKKPSTKKPSAEKASADKAAGGTDTHKDESDASNKPSTQEAPASKLPDPGDESGAAAVLPFRLTAFAQDKQDQAREQKPEESKADAAKAPDSGSAEQKPEEPKTASEVLRNPPAAEPTQPVGESKNPPAAPTQPAGESKNPAAEEKAGEEPSAPAAPPAPASADKAGEAGKAGEKEEKPQEHPSARIKDQIRSRLAIAKITTIFQNLQAMMRDYGNKWRLEKAKKQDVASLPALDFAALARQNDLSWGETGLVSAIQLMGSDIGVSYVDYKQPDFRQPVAAKAFGTALLLYRPESSSDLRRNGYLFWKVEETKEYTPKFDDEGVRQRVLQAWKMIEARKLAKQEAERLAAEARKAKEPLADVFRSQPEIHVTLTAPFSWLTYGNLPMLGSQARPELSKVSGVDLPGPDFMRTVFDLPPGGVGVAMNHPQTVAYVVRVVEVAPSDDVLWQQFEADPYEKYAAVAFDDQRTIYRAWLDELKASAGLQWERKPERRAEMMPEAPDE